MRGFAISVLNKKPNKFTLVELLDAYNYHWAAHNYKEREEWQRARMVAYWAAAAHQKKGFKHTDIIQFGWEQKTAEKGTSSNKWTKEEILKLKSEGHPFFRNGTK